MGPNTSRPGTEFTVNCSCCCANPFISQKPSTHSAITKLIQCLSAPPFRGMVWDKYYSISVCVSNLVWLDKRARPRLPSIAVDFPEVIQALQHFSICRLFLGATNSGTKC